MRYLTPTRRTYLRDPFFNDVNHIFDNFFETPLKTSFNLQGDVQESDQFLLLTFDLPGLKEKDINIEVKDRHLKISGERHQEKSDELKNHYRSRNFGSFSKTFTLPDNVKNDSIEADYTNGVLKVLLPKKEEAQPKKIEVQSKKGNLLTQFFKKEESA